MGLGTDWEERPADLKTEVRATGPYRLTLARNPTPAEVDHAQTFLTAREQDLGHTPWPEYAQILLGTSEFIYLH